MNDIKEKHMVGGHIGLLRRADGSMRTVLGIKRCDQASGRTYLHVRGAVIDFFASPSELRRHGYTVIEATPEVMSLWNP